ncbi:hypothetical protein NQ315_003691 [Exocentrus adspersus]|uniref:Uncharacterized protein n=1 Tax=Exocentrus adspersus TaxID=1586481 RepID=A0AAV8V9A6_9CUCU|nr:hypothetical protein NQ315_003691 [Exocentrus adspersus]
MAMSEIDNCSMILIVSTYVTIYVISKLCSGESLPEVEIISLLEEQIPRYRLRADTLTKFGDHLFRSNMAPIRKSKPDEGSGLGSGQLKRCKKI